MGLSGWAGYPPSFSKTISLSPRLATHNREDEGSVGRAGGHIAGRYGNKGSLWCLFLCSSLDSFLALGL